MLLMRGALSSGAVSSSWIWNLLTAVFTVTGFSLLGSVSGGKSSLQSPYVAFTLLLAAYLLDVSYTSFGGWIQAGLELFSLPVLRRSAPFRFIRLSLRPSPARRQRGMADQPRSAADVIELVREHDVRFIRLWFTDVLGQLKSFSVNSSELEDAFAGGMGFDGSSITGFNPIEESDMLAVPDPSTFALIPCRPEEDAAARMFCDVQVPGGGPYEGDPRWIMQRALKRAEELGFDAYNIGPELEFFYFRSAKPQSGVPEVLDEGGYFDLTTLDAGSDLRRETVLALEKMGIHV